MLRTTPSHVRWRVVICVPLCCYMAAGTADGTQSDISSAKGPSKPGESWGGWGGCVCLGVKDLDDLKPSIAIQGQLYTFKTLIPRERCVAGLCLSDNSTPRPLWTALSSREAAGRSPGTLQYIVVENGITGDRTTRGAQCLWRLVWTSETFRKAAAGMAAQANRLR